MASAEFSASRLFEKCAKILMVVLSFGSERVERLKAVGFIFEVSQRLGFRV